PEISRRYSTRSWTRRCDCAEPHLACCGPMTARWFARSRRNVPEAYRVYMANRAFVLDGAAFMGQAILGRRVVHIADNAAEEPYRHRVPIAVAAVELAGTRTFVHVPLIKGDIVLVVLTVFSSRSPPVH